MSCLFPEGSSGTVEEHCSSDLLTRHVEEQEQDIVQNQGCPSGRVNVLFRGTRFEPRNLGPSGISTAGARLSKSNSLPMRCIEQNAPMSAVPRCIGNLKPRQPYLRIQANSRKDEENPSRETHGSSPLVHFHNVIQE
jgi:hypothetical protein